MGEVNWLNVRFGSLALRNASVKKHSSADQLPEEEEPEADDKTGSTKLKPRPITKIKRTRRAHFTDFDDDEDSYEPETQFEKLVEQIGAAFNQTIEIWEKIGTIG